MNRLVLPNFLVPGAQKAGTTTLYHYLASHPEIYLPRQKETKFFVEDRHYERGLSHYSAAHFRDCRGELAIGDVDPEYMFIGHAAARIGGALDCSRLRLIFVLRNPITRAFSHYLMTYRRGLEPQPFGRALDLEHERMGGGLAEQVHYSYASRGFYREQIERFLPFVDRSRMHFVLTDELHRSPEEVMRGVYRFLGVSPDHKPELERTRFHEARGPRSIFLLRWLWGDGPEKAVLRCVLPFKGVRRQIRRALRGYLEDGPVTVTLGEAERERLARLYREPNARLGEFIGRDLSHWEPA